MRGYRKRSARNKKSPKKAAKGKALKEDSIFITNFSDPDNSEVELHDREGRSPNMNSCAQIAEVQPYNQLKPPDTGQR